MLGINFALVFILYCLSFNQCISDFNRNLNLSHSILNILTFPPSLMSMHDIGAPIHSIWSNNDTHRKRIVFLFCIFSRAKKEEKKNHNQCEKQRIKVKVLFFDWKGMIKVLEFWLDIEVMSCLFFTQTQTHTHTKINIFMEMVKDIHWFMNTFMTKVHATNVSHSSFTREPLT